jgi:phage/conjugal plasmid C-4 type zinc finger TraR family protein
VDDVDIAQELEERHRSMALAAMTRSSPPLPAPVALDCVDCREPIDARRLRAMPDAMRCIECQRRWEARGRWK